MAPDKGKLRLLAEEWFGRNPYHLTHDSFVKHGGYHGNVRSRACQEFYDYVRTRLRRDDGNLLYAVETDTFCERMYKATRLIRGPFGIVRANHKTTPRSIGEPACHVWSEVKKYLNNNPTALARHLDKARLCTQRHSLTEHGQVMNMLRADHKREVRQQRLSTYQISGDNLKGLSAVDIAETIMNEVLDRLGGFSPREYAEHIGGVYVFYTEQQSKGAIEDESIRFLIDGQRQQQDGSHHNAVLMWNKNQVRFPNNICLYQKRFDHDLEAISAVECRILGIEHEILIDECISDRDGRAIEQACHYVMDKLPLGHRLHRVPGAGKGTKLTSTKVDGKRRVVGITFVPPYFFENNPDICIVGSADGRNGDDTDDSDATNVWDEDKPSSSDCKPAARKKTPAATTPTVSFSAADAPSTVVAQVGTGEKRTALTVVTNNPSSKKKTKKQQLLFGAPPPKSNHSTTIHKSKALSFKKQSAKTLLSPTNPFAMK